MSRFVKFLVHHGSCARSQSDEHRHKDNKQDQEGIDVCCGDVWGYERNQIFRRTKRENHHHQGQDARPSIRGSATCCFSARSGPR
jgi:hypothetical protein